MNLGRRFSRADPADMVTDMIYVTLLIEALQEGNIKNHYAA